MATAAVMTLVLASPALGSLTVPDTVRGTKRCGTAEGPHADARFRVRVIRGRVSCKAARRLVRHMSHPHGWRYYDWTKGGNGPWTDILERRDHRAVVGAILICTPELCGPDG